MDSETSPTGASSSAPGKRWPRLLAIMLAVVALGLGAAYLTLSRMFPPARLAELLAAEVGAATGRHFHIGGDLSIRLLPRIAVVAHDMVLGNVAWGSRPDMARLKRASFEVALKPLLDGRIRIISVEAEGADLLLESDGRGGVNWLFTPEHPPEPTTSPQAGPAAAVPGTAASAPAVSLERLLATDARLTYRDGVTGITRSVVIERFELQSQGLQDRLAATLDVGGPRWQVDGQVGRLLGLMGGGADWPFDLTVAAPGLALSAKGAVGVGPQAGRVRTTVSARITAAAALLPLLPQAAGLPLPIDLDARFDRSPDALQIQPLRLAVAGQVLTGQATVHTDAPSLRIAAQLASPSLDLTRVLAALPATAAGSQMAAAATGKPATAAHAGGPLFSDHPLPLGALATLPEMQLALHIDRLALPGAPPLTTLSAQLRTRPGRLEIEPLSFGFVGGQVNTQLSVAHAASVPSQTTLRIDARNLSVDALGALLPSGRYLRGGQAQLEARLALSGDTPRQLAASATGPIVLQVSGTALIGNTAMIDRNPMATVLDAVLPKRSAGGPMGIECAVLRLPLQRGLATIDRSIALETDQLGVAASGELNLRAQTLALAFHPRVKKGLGLSPASLAQLVMLEGPIQAPRIAIDAKGTAREAATWGAAVATGGLSLLATRLLDQPEDNHACQTALTGRKAGAATATSTGSIAKSATDLGKKAGGLIDKLSIRH